ncbi:uncharacterized protein [Haliotis asinina]|uniref:uncharacterized protein n=1 Tax=Haliotis asinina TaxID=109174 RepID=UPI003531B013
MGKCWHGRDLWDSWSLLFLTGLLVTGHMLYLTNYFEGTGSWQNNHQALVSVPVPATTVFKKCPNFLEQVSIGQWVKRPHNATQVLELERFYHSVLQDRAPIPSTLERSDGKCGNYTYDETPAATHWRAVCSPIGQTPCCYNNHCVARNVEKCRCEYCFDLRNRIHAEMAEWTPRDDRCRLKEHTPEELCDLLDGSSLYFVGDSLIRHAFTAFLMAIRGDHKDGAMKPGLSKEWHRRCTDLNMFGAVACRPILDQRPTVCGGRVSIRRLPHETQDDTGELLDLVRNITNVKRTMIISGIALHVRTNYTAVQEYLQPAFDFLNTRGALWPHFLFTGLSDFGALMKADKNLLRSQRRMFNNKMASFVERHGALYLDLYNLTHGVRSFDGNHFGVGLNRAKAFIISNYIQHLKDRGEW